MEQFFYFWGVNFHKAVNRRILTMFVSEYHYEQTTYYYSSIRWMFKTTGRDRTP